MSKHITQTSYTLEVSRCPLSIRLTRDIHSADVTTGTCDVTRQTAVLSDRILGATSGIKTCSGEGSGCATI